MGETILKQHNEIVGVDFSDRPNLIVASLNGPQSASTTNIIEDADRYSNTIRVASSADISPGDLLLIEMVIPNDADGNRSCLLYTSPSPRDATLSRMPSSA